MKTEEWVLASSHNPSGWGNPHLPLCRFPPSLPCSRCREQELEQAAADCAVCSARGQPVAICHPKVCAQPGAGTGFGLPKHTQVVKQGVGASGCSPSPSACSHLLHHIPGSDGLGIFNSFCHQAGIRNSAQTSQFLHFPAMSRCCLCKLCAWGTLDSFTFGKGLRMTSGNISLQPGNFGGVSPHLGIPSPELPGCS